MKFSLRNDNRSLRGHKTSAIRLDSSLIPASMKRGKSSSRFASHDSRNCFTGTWADTGGINDMGCGSTGVASARTRGTRSELWVDFLLIGISCMVKHSLIKYRWTIERREGSLLRQASNADGIFGISGPGPTQYPEILHLEV